ncbi:type II toxin-antitoxin system RelE/ParE family toxin [Commensalibacter nepenthis]|uniref:Type II toxin-antitoxin system RelE/ParE family toxin n=1 Tax=Commensalibacter nepenthis TaxID=3043872 RepID=A0ABT6Q4D0_9PROT|nr:type II toxin-antitoxin system RelE/ParE family toxin [Commensalibacter sp. TBRC 10068]MDI2111721.1 type II toxin-antitoxin system RelE/ParE family toxin [Commensalibacter sp. TBRC 10068]
MSRVIITSNAFKGLEKCRIFLAEKSPYSTKKAANVIKKYFLTLEKAPHIGRPYPERSELRELVIRFGVSGYIALYRYIPQEDIVYILAFKYQKEEDY